MTATQIAAVTVDALWPLVEQFRPEDVERLTPLRDRYDAETLSHELWGACAAMVLGGLRRRYLAFDWRREELRRQNRRLLSLGTQPKLLLRENRDGRLTTAAQRVREATS